MPVQSRTVNYDEQGRAIVQHCPLCGIHKPGAIWGAEEIASILQCRGCGANVLVDIGPARRSDGGGA